MSYKCERCDFETTLKTTYNRHIKSKKHMDKMSGQSEKKEKDAPLYECKACNFKTAAKGALKKHETTKRHLNQRSIESAPASSMADKEMNAASRSLTGQFQTFTGLQDQAPVPTQEPALSDKEKKKRFKHHMGALRLLQELSSGKITENDIAEYMKKHHPDTIGISMSDDEEEDEDDDPEEKVSDHSSDSENEEPSPNQQTTEPPETFTFYINGPPTSPPPVPHVRHQPHYYEFPPETPDGKLPPPPTDYRLPLFIENRRKIAESKDPEVEAQQYNDIRQFIIDFLNGTQSRTEPEAERFRWQLNEITKLFIHNNMNTILNRQNLPGTI